MIAMDIPYSPVQYDYREFIEEEIKRSSRGKVFYFNADNVVSCAEGLITCMEEREGKGIFITMNPEEHIRIDRIITLFGKPGAAYDEYEAYGNVCLDCTGGYPVD